MTWLIPLISSFCFRSGGVGKDDRFLPFMKPPTPWANKWWRWGIGIPIGIVTGCWWLIPAYLIVTNCMPYGEKSWLNFLGRDLKWLIYGLAFGSCSFFCLPFGLALTNTLLGAVSFWGLMKLSNDGMSGDWYGRWKDDSYWRNRIWYLDHSLVELCFGFIATVVYIKGG